MIWVCPECKKIFNRDMRLKINKFFLDKNGFYKSSCKETGKSTRCKPFLKTNKHSQDCEMVAFGYSDCTCGFDNQ